MSKAVPICVLALMFGSPTPAIGKLAVYEIALTHATVQTGDSDSVLSVLADSAGKEPSFVTEFDSLRFTWNVVKSQMEYECYNGSGSPIHLVWDSMYAVDTRGFLIDLVPSGVPLNPDMTAPPKKVGVRKKFEGWFFTMTRQDRYSGITNPMLPLYAGDNRMGPFAQTVPLMKGKSFKYSMAVNRKDRFERYVFTFVVLDAYLK